MPKYKYDDGDKIALDDAKLPIIIYDDGTEKGFDANQALQKIAELNAEAKKHREGKEESEKKATEALSKFEGLEPEKAREALEKLKNLGDGELLKADQVAELKAKARQEAVESYENKIAEMKKHFEKERISLSSERDQLVNEIFGSTIDRSFQDSIQAGVIGNKTSIANLKMARGYFGNQFRIEESGGKRRIVAYHWDSDRQIISTGQNAGEPAGVEEALATLFETDPYKMTIQKDVKGGSGSTGGTGGNPKTGELSEKEFMAEIFNKRK